MTKEGHIISPASSRSFVSKLEYDEENIPRKVQRLRVVVAGIIAVFGVLLLGTFQKGHGTVIKDEIKGNSMGKQHSSTIPSLKYASDDKRDTTLQNRSGKMYSRNDPLNIDPSKSDLSTERFKTGFPASTFFQQFQQELKKTLETDDVSAIQRDIELLVSEAKAEIENPSCIPVVCTSGVHFFSHQVPKLLLVSRPGSGNTWTRTLIRSGMRHFTGSPFTDLELARGGFKGELYPPRSKKTGVVKSHYPRPRYGGPGHWAQGVIHLVRSPFDAFLANCQRKFIKKTHKNTHSHATAISPEEVVNLCKRYALNKHPKGWTTNFEFWEPNGSDGSAFTDLSSTFHLKVVRGKPVFTIFYEDLIRNLQETLLYLFSILKYFYRNQMPSVYEATVCALRDKKAAEKFHRAKTTQVVYANNVTVVKVLCDQFKPFWNVAKWGKCTGTLQKHRTDVTNTPPIELPEEVCTP
mmetsp:Transcript_27632/g.44160  ORF Transcript_27632/g.44160 Transcript_27632/m.44160 type:complete len:465 (+) Transcript_27632:364-1758(+)|eukprot:CAMPEP_0203750574 /NCGR_PEP_ID=MMETSP0098-20131031/4793_1 /ASSEMBLY_ACC=CAM_ASM_000208 /TAXON_ID=96639 /ORGANISM=" , Strain NY0313808BC1" /LENGTH=464 /DNA_ID=CAMNT_0050639945 /DNA_START=302 /DNA_END=1696 /DNA_ORIENTATION=-